MKVRFPKSSLNAGLSFISQDKGMSESSLQSIENALGPRLIWTGGLTKLDTSRGGPSSMLQKATMLTLLARNPNITVATRKGGLVSCLTSTVFHIVLPSLV